MKYKAIIFDLDGVICHTDQYHYLAWKQLANKLEIYFDEQINNRLRGVSRIDSLNILLEESKKEYSHEEKLRLADEKNQYYRNLLANLSPSDLSAEVKKTLDYLRSAAYKLAIGSSSKNAQYILERIGMNGYFDTVVDGNQIEHSKPDPEVFLLAAQQLNFQPKECLVVEDAKTGIDAAIRGGFEAVGIGSASDYTKAEYHIREFAQLKDIIHS